MLGGGNHRVLAPETFAFHAALKLLLLSTCQTRMACVRQAGYLSGEHSLRMPVRTRGG